MNLISADHISPLDMFKIGVGPSSSHTVGPMVAALSFRRSIEPLLADASGDDLEIEVELFGSLSATGKGHATDGAVCAGLRGLHPRSASIDEIWSSQDKLLADPFLEVEGRRISFNPGEDIIWRAWTIEDRPLPHPNTMIFRLKEGDTILAEQVLASVGGGFVEPVDESGLEKLKNDEAELQSLPYPYNTAAEFVEQCLKNDLRPWQVVIANQEVLGLEEKKLREELSEILDTMERCIERGLDQEGILPGGLNVKRRARSIYRKLESGDGPAWSQNDLRPSVYAMAVNEENAAGGRVVTAPTNGSSGLIPAVWRTLKEVHDLDRTTLQNGLIVASVIGALVKVHASISGAEVGCQGEVGTSCAMAAAGAVAMLDGTANQIEQAAEIGIEHHLGMTCDPIMGLVQVPCIERNAMGAVKALNAAALSLASDGIHLVSLDKALAVMKQTGIDMNQKYKETSTGGLALG
ncbi:MAG: L-serine ammonia-lyase [Candidatus Obscuribacterales bacterium]